MSTATVAQSPTKPLSTRDPNTSSPTKPTTKPSSLKDPGNPSPQSMEYHRKVLQNRLAADNADKGTYVSPSDTIMSPCTAKLSAYKGKKFAKAKPQSLFAKMAPKGMAPGAEEEAEKEVVFGEKA